MGRTLDYLIIGQGVAGSFLAWNLLARHQHVVIVDNDHAHSSSIISPGIINPITGQRSAITSQFDVFYQQALHAYQDLSATFSQPFFNSKPIIRIFRTSQEYERFKYIKQHENTGKYIQALKPQGAYGDVIQDPYGSAVVSCGGYCHTHNLLTEMRKYFKDQDLLVGESFNVDELTLGNQGVGWRGDKYQHVIFCEGFKAWQNPWFKDLPFNCAKGEILHVEMSDDNLPDAMIMEKKWCVPLGNFVWSIGANYNREDINCAPTQHARLELLKEIDDLIHCPKKILGHFAGVRPVMIDQMPVLGLLQQHPFIGIFNGLGSKGYLMAPMYATMLTDFLLQKKNLPRTVDVNRFKLS